MSFTVSPDQGVLSLLSHLTFVVFFSVWLLPNGVICEELYLHNEETHDSLLQVIFTMWVSTAYFLVSASLVEEISWIILHGVLCMSYRQAFAPNCQTFFVYKRETTVVGISMVNNFGKKRIFCKSFFLKAMDSKHQPKIFLITFMFLSEVV